MTRPGRDGDAATSTTPATSVAATLIVANTIICSTSFGERDQYVGLALIPFTLLQAALSAGVNQSSGLQFEVSDPARGRDQAIAAAYADARSKALLLAQAAGRTLGRAVSISEGGLAAPPPYPMPRPMVMRAEAQSVSEVPVEAGAQDVSYSLSVVFELR